MSLFEAILLGTFLIKYVESLEFDINVGLEKGKLPQIFVINQDIFGDYELNKDDKSKILEEVNKRIENIRDCLLLFPDGKRVEKPIWGKSKQTIN